MPDEAEESNRPPLAGSPIFVSTLMANGRVVLDANDVIAMLLTRGKESNSLEAEQLCWQMATWIQNLVFGAVQNTFGPGQETPGEEAAEPHEEPPPPTA